MLSRHHTPSTLALSRRRGERSGRGQPRPFRLHGTVSSSGQGKQTGLAPGQGGLSRVALPGQRIALGQDRTGWQPLIDAAHYFHPHKTGTLTNRETPWQLGYEVTGRGLFISAEAATFVKSATQERTQNTFD